MTLPESILAPEPEGDLLEVDARPASTPNVHATRTLILATGAGTLAAVWSDNLAAIVTHFLHYYVPVAIQINVDAIVNSSMPVIVTAVGAAVLAWFGSRSRNVAHEKGTTPLIGKVV